MQLDTGGQRVAALAIVLAFLAVIALVAGWIVTSLSDKNVTALGNWLGDNVDSIVAGALALVPSVATYLFGRRAGRKAGKTEAYASAIATAEGKPTGNQAAEVLRSEAKGHNLTIAV